MFAGPGAGVSVPKLFASETYGNISFQDYQTGITPSSFQGFAGDVSIGVGVGSLSVSFNRTRLGRAFSIGSGGEQTGGLNVGASLTLGSSTVTDVKLEDCRCEQN